MTMLYRMSFFYLCPHVGELVNRFVPSNSRVRPDVLYVDIVTNLSSSTLTRLFSCVRVASS